LGDDFEVRFARRFPFATSPVGAAGSPARFLSLVAISLISSGE
jgi:hypothetical protein